MSVIKWLKSLFVGQSPSDPGADFNEEHGVYCWLKMPIRLMPMNRGEWIEDPLDEWLQENDLGEIDGGGTYINPDEYGVVEIDVSFMLHSAAMPIDSRILPFVREFGLPKGSVLKCMTWDSETDDYVDSELFNVGTTDALALVLDLSDGNEDDLLAEGQKLSDDFAEILSEDYRFFVSNKVDDSQVYIFYVYSYQEAAAKLAAPVQDSSLASRLEMKNITRPVMDL